MNAREPTSSARARVPTVHRGLPLSLILLSSCSYALQPPGYAPQAPYPPGAEGNGAQPQAYSQPQPYGPQAQPQAYSQAEQAPQASAPQAQADASPNVYGVTPAQCRDPGADFDCLACNDPDTCERTRVTRYDRRVAHRVMRLQRGHPAKIRVHRNHCYRVIVDTSEATLNEGVRFEVDIDTHTLSSTFSLRQETPTLWFSSDSYCATSSGTYAVAAWTGREWSRDESTVLQTADAGSGRATLDFYERRIPESETREMERDQPENVDACDACARDMDSCLRAGFSGCDVRYRACLHRLGDRPSDCRN